MQPLGSRLLALGDKLGKYELVRQIAIGGMAELYLARTVGIEGFEKLVVIKRILPQFATNDSFVAMFVNEARLAATLQHPNVAQVYDIGVDAGEYFFAMEYVHGEDLDHVSQQAHVRGETIPLDASLTLVAHLCAGLHYAHERIGPDGSPLAIVHRDVSPSNVLVSYDGSVKLVDFGIARATSRTTSAHGGLKGKIAFMSPEQCRADTTLDRRSDLYSIGTLLYQLTTGRLPFTGETEYAILNQIVNVDVAPPRSFVPTYPESLERIVLRALARDPAQRYSSALELQGALEDFAHDSRLRVSPRVLARMMSVLFPTRLAEWDAAKSRGAFFVEQHVVRTWIEKTPDPNDPAARMLIKAAQHALAEAEPTTIQQQPHVAYVTPIPGGFAIPAAGTLVTSSSSSLPVVARSAAPVEIHAEVTERVSPMRPPDPQVAMKTMVIQMPRKKKRGAAYVIGGLVLAGVAAGGVVLALGGSEPPVAASSASAAAAPTPQPAPTPTPQPIATPTPTPTPIATPTPTPIATPTPTPIATPTPTPDPVPTSAPVAKKLKPKPRIVKAKPATPTKEEPWNADSVFMPVRSH